MKTKSKKEAVDQQEVTPDLKNGKAVGVYYDNELNRFMMVTLDIYPDSQSAKIIETQKLTASKIAAILNSEVKLKQLLEKQLKSKEK